MSEKKKSEYVYLRDRMERYGDVLSFFTDGLVLAAQGGLYVLALIWLLLSKLFAWRTQPRKAD